MLQKLALKSQKRQGKKGRKNNIRMIGPKEPKCGKQVKKNIRQIMMKMGQEVKKVIQGRIKMILLRNLHTQRSSSKMVLK